MLIPHSLTPEKLSTDTPDGMVVWPSSGCAPGPTDRGSLLTGKEGSVKLDNWRSRRPFWLVLQEGGWLVRCLRGLCGCLVNFNYLS